MSRKLAIFLPVLVTGLVLDQVTKVLILVTLPVGGKETLIPGFLNLVHVRNKGAAFGLLSGWSAQFAWLFFVVVTALVLVVLGLVALSRGGIDAFVYDAPILRYVVSTEFAGKVMILSETLQKQPYGFGLWAGSPLREPINQVMLQKINAPEWQDILYRYLGR